MRRSEIKVGADVWHRLPGGCVGKYLGTVVGVGTVVVRYRDADGVEGIASPAELTQPPRDACAC